MNEFPEANRVDLEKHLHAAKEEKAKGKPPKHFRLLYQMLHDLIKAQSREAAAEADA